MTDNTTYGGGCNEYALFAVNAPIIRWSRCIVAVTVFWCSLTESTHALILTVSPLYSSQSHQTVFYFEIIISSELKWNKYHTPWSPILAHTKVSVYLTGFRNAQFRSVTLRKSISWNLAPEEKIILFPPGFQSYLSNRTQVVNIGKTFSEPLEVTCGHGSPRQFAWPSFVFMFYVILMTWISVLILIASFFCTLMTALFFFLTKILM